MKKNNTLKGLLGLLFLTTALSSAAQITESIGTVSSNGASIASHESLNRFDVADLTYSGTGTIRTSSVSNGYLGSSAGLNVQLLATQTIELRTLDASLATLSDSITFGIAKSTNASDGTEMALEYSIDNGLTWTAIPFTALPTGSGTTFNLATPKWYRRAVAFPAGAISANLRLRFRSNVAAGVQNPQFRIDDIRTTAGTPIVCGTSTASVSVSGDVVFCAETGNVDLTATTSIAGPAYQWYNQDGIIAGETSATLSGVVNSGTFYVIVNGAGGCQATSPSQYVRSYPAPQFCFDEITACEGESIEVCATLSTQDLIISEYVEGTGFNKYIEIFNGTCDPVNLANYELRTYANGSCNASVPVIALSGMLASGDVYVIVNRDADDTLIGNLVTDDLLFNGNDAVELYNADAGQAADIIGSICFDPGSAWRDTSTVTSSPTKGYSTLNKTLVRKACVYSGVIINPALAGPTGFPTLYTEWDTLTVDDISGLGTHTIGGTNYDFTVTGGSTELSQSGNCVTLRVGPGASDVTLTNADFCGFNNCFSEVVVATVTGTACDVRSGGSADMSSTGVNVFPNPSTEAATVTFDNEKAGNVSITLVDMQGKAIVVISDKLMEAGAQRIELPVAHLQAGTYVGRIETANGLQTFRVVKLNH